MAERLLEVKDLHVQFATEDGVVQGGRRRLVHARPRPGARDRRRVRLGQERDRDDDARPHPGVNAKFEGEVLYKGRDLLSLSEDELQSVRGNEIAMIFQDPMTSLNPVYRVGDADRRGDPGAQREHEQAPGAGRASSCCAGRDPEPDQRVDDYPHQFSGGMRQRAMIAMALANNPDVLIADEPTTALDVTIQAQIIELIGRLKDEFNSAVILITHDLGVVAEIADEIAVMYAGRVVERGTKRQIFYDPQHPYTWGLLGSIPRLDRPRPSACTRSRARRPR